MTATIQNARQMGKPAMNAKKWAILRAVVLDEKMLRGTKSAEPRKDIQKTDAEDIPNQASQLSRTN